MSISSNKNKSPRSILIVGASNLEQEAFANSLVRLGCDVKLASNFEEAKEYLLSGENIHIINGHVPVHQSAGESPVKCGGKVLIIDGGFCRAYHKETGIAGYTLIYNSYGLSLTAHEPFESTEKAIQEEKDIVSRQVAVRYNMKRQLVGDTDQGQQIRQRIRELKELIEAYRTAQLKELM